MEFKIFASRKSKKSKIAAQVQEKFNNLDFNVAIKEGIPALTGKESEIYREMLKRVYDALWPLIEYKTGHKYEYADDFVADITYEQSKDYDKLKKIELIFLSLLSSFKIYRQKVLAGKSDIWLPDVFVANDSVDIDLDKFASYVCGHIANYIKADKLIDKIEYLKKYDSSVSGINKDDLNINHALGVFLFCTDQELSNKMRRYGELKDVLDTFICRVMSTYYLIVSKGKELTPEGLHNDSAVSKSCYKIFNRLAVEGIDIIKVFEDWKKQHEKFGLIKLGIEENGLVPEAENCIKARFPGMSLEEFGHKIDSPAFLDELAGISQHNYVEMIDALDNLDKDDVLATSITGGENSLGRDQQDINSDIADSTNNLDSDFIRNSQIGVIRNGFELIKRNLLNYSELTMIVAEAFANIPESLVIEGVGKSFDSYIDYFESHNYDVKLDDGNFQRELLMFLEILIRKMSDAIVKKYNSSVGLDNDEVTDKVMNDSDVDVKKSWDQMGRELKDERIHYLIGLAIQYGTPLTRENIEELYTMDIEDINKQIDEYENLVKQASMTGNKLK